MAELVNNSRGLLNDFQQIRTRFNSTEHLSKEESLILNHQKKAIDILKEDKKKYQEDFKSLSKLCNEQARRITELYEFERKTEILADENTNLKNIVEDLKHKLSATELNQDEILQKCITEHNLELTNKEEQFKIRERELQENIEALQAKFDLQLSEKDEEMKKLENNYDEVLKEASNKENNLNNVIYKLNHQLSMSTSILQKKIRELEEKLKAAEREKSLYNVSKGNFVSANNVLNKFPKFNQSNSSNEATQSENLNKSNSTTRNISKTIEKNTVNRFNFHKRHSTNHSVERILLNESFNPFEMHKQMSSGNRETNECNHNKQENKEKPIGFETYTYEHFSEGSYHSQQEYEKEESKNIDEIEETNSVIGTTNQQNRARKQNISPNIKKRKMFNPKNTDYLN